jgi:hypothetical protein
MQSDFFRTLFHKKEFVIAAAFFIASSLSFGLGYLANREFNHAPIVIEKCSNSESQSK